MGCKIANYSQKKRSRDGGQYDEEIEAFKYLYKEQFKEFERLMKDRGKQLEDNDVYRRNIWMESLDLINHNLSKLLECISELEGSVNQVGKRKDMLITVVQLTSDIYVKGKEIPPSYERQRLEMASPKFDPQLASFDIDPSNVIPPKAYKRRK